MTSSTVLRVKRRLEDNPQDALVLLCKRMKTDEEEVSPSLFVFRGSVDNQDTTPVKKIAPKLPTKLKSGGPLVDDIIKKIRLEKQETASENRYKIVNCSRGIKENSNAEDEDLFDLVDLHETNVEAGDGKYKYDLYTPATDDFDISMIDNLVSIENYESELILTNYRGEKESDEEEDDDDSNDENNWRNDYPDSNPSSREPSITEEDMLKAMQNCNIVPSDSEDELLSMSSEENIYDNPPDLFDEDVKRYGSAYAKYKAKIQNEDPNLTCSTSYVHCSKVLDEEAIDGYKDGSDDGFYYGEEEDSEQFKQQYGEKDSSDEFSPD